jgi:hypothetical protein
VCIIIYTTLDLLIEISTSVVHVYSLGLTLCVSVNVINKLETCMCKAV